MSGKHEPHFVVNRCLIKAFDKHRRKKELQERQHGDDAGDPENGADVLSNHDEGSLFFELLMGKVLLKNASVAKPQATAHRL